jgi:hypothetical protein
VLLSLTALRTRVVEGTGMSLLTSASYEEAVQSPVLSLVVIK